MQNKITPYNTPSRWRSSPETVVTCSSCQKNKTGTFFNNNENQYECISCALRNMAQAAHDKLTNLTWNHELLIIFKPTASLSEKIGMLLKSKELIAAIDKAAPKLKEQILENIIFALGYESPHPLSRLFRTLTKNQILASKNYFTQSLLTFAAPGSLLPSSESRGKTINLQLLHNNTAQILAYLTPSHTAAQQFISETLLNAREDNNYAYIDFFVSKNNCYLPSEPLHSYSVKLRNSIQYYQLIKEHINQESTQKVSPLHIEQTINSVYTLKQLKDIYPQYLQRLHAVTGITPSFTWSGNNAQKKHYVKLFRDVIMNKKLLTAFIQELPVWIASAFNEMIWNNKTLTLTEISARGGINLPYEKVSSYLYYDSEKYMLKEAMLFQHQFDPYHYNIKPEINCFIHNTLASIFRAYLPKPVESELQFKDHHSPEYRFISTTEIMNQLPYVSAYVKEAGIKRSKNGGKILKSCLKEIRSLCTIEEPYPDIKELDSIRTTMLIEILENAEGRDVSIETEPEKLIRELFNLNFSLYNHSFNDFIHFLNYLKIAYFEENHNDMEKRCRLERTSIHYLLEHLQPGKWVTIENIHRNLNAHELLPRPLDLSFGYLQASFNTTIMGAFGSGRDYINFNEVNANETLVLPYLKSLMFVLNTLGVVDISLTLPENQHFHHKNNPWLSAYDGIKEVSLTPLGSWLFEKTGTDGSIDGTVGGLGVGRTNVITRQEPSAQVILDDKRLLITIEGKDPKIELTLARLSVPAGVNCYQVTSEIFLKDCITKTDIQKKIQKFKNNIQPNPPSIWEDFFESLLKKADPLEYKAEKYFTFRLDPENTELIRLLFSDSLLRKYIIKAEDYHILVREEHYKLVQKRLAEFGYLVPGREYLA